MSAQATQGTDQKLSGLMDRLKANPRLPLIVAGAAAIAILVVLFLWARAPDYRVLFSNLSDSDGGVIIARLDQMQVPYRFSEGGQAILIPAESVEQTRMALASEGLPKGGGVGFELMDGQSFGISQFAEHVNYQRALEGELARSIESIDSVQTARVHLAMPQESVFVRDRRQPSASVILTLYRNRAVSEGQVSAITHLVSASVSNLPVNQVTVVDQNGNLLSQPGGDDTRNLNDAQLKYTAQVEETYRKRIETLLSTIVGHSNVRAQVTASIDFSIGEHTQETYDPNQDPNQASVRSIQASESVQSGSGGIGGIPGALSNQPAPTVPSPVENAANNEQQNNDQEDDGEETETTQAPATPRSSTSSSTTNYEINRLIRHVQEDTGQVQRLSVAVVVNYRNQTGEDGQTEMVALSDDRMAQIQRLVRESMGYSEARGDSLEVVNAAFSQQAEAQAPTLAWYENPEIISLAKTLGRYLLIAIVAFILWRKLLKPLVERQRTLMVPAANQGEAASGGTLLATAGDDEDEKTEESDIAEQIAKKQKRRARIEHETLLSTVRDQAQKDPRMVAMIIRGWINGKD